MLVEFWSRCLAEDRRTLRSESLKKIIKKIKKNKINLKMKFKALRNHYTKCPIQ